MSFNTRKRLPFVATGLALALSCMPALAEDKAPAPDLIKPSVSTAKETTLTGKVVDLHAYMTGERDDRSTSDRISPSDRAKPEDRDIKADDKGKHVMRHKNEIMGLETSTGLVLICFKDAPGIFATPRTDDQPGTTPGTRPVPTTPRDKDLNPADRTTTDAARPDNHARWLDKQVQVTGSMYEKNGIKFLVVTKVMSSTEATPKTGTDTTPRP